MIAFSGRIDRIDKLVLPDGKTYFMIVDNKMSSRDVKQNSIIAGLQLQLPLYIRAAQNGLNGYEAAGRTVPAREGCPGGRRRCRKDHCADR